MGKVEDRPATYEDWLATPEGEWWELADGKLWRWGDPDGILEDGEVTTPSADHERVVRSIFRVLDGWAIAHGGEAFASGLGVRMADGRLLVPDALLVTADHLDRIGSTHLDGAPDLVVEVSSHTTYRHDRIRKRRWYEDAGVAEYWFIDRDARTIERYVLAGGGYDTPTFHRPGEHLAAHLDGLTIDVGEVLGPTAPDAGR